MKGNGLLVKWRLQISVVFVLVASLLAIQPKLNADQTLEDPSSGQVYFAVIDGSINPGTARYLAHAISQAESAGATALLVQLNTPGGLLDSTRTMVESMAASQVPILVFVGPDGARATSAGAFILLAADIAAMSPGTHVGASSPVLLGGQELPPTIKDKAISDTTAFMRSIAESRGRNIEVAERFVTEALSLTSNEALDQGLINLLASSKLDLLAKLDGQDFQYKERSFLFKTSGSEISEVSPRFSDWFMMNLAHPQIAYYLLALGMLGIYLELMNPGLLFPGLTGLVSFFIALILMNALPAQYGFLALVILGLTLMCLEFFVAGFGALGIIGFLAFLIGSLNLFDDPLIFDFHRTVWLTSAGLGLALFSLLFVIRRGWISLDRSKRGRWVGKQGIVMADFIGHGYVLVGDRKMQALSVHSLRRNQLVQITEVLPDLSVKVVAASPKKQPSPPESNS